MFFCNLHVWNSGPRKADKGTFGVPFPPDGKVKGSFLVVFWYKKGYILFGIG